MENNVLERILDGREAPNHLSLDLLRRITQNFSDERKIGAGGFGEVYKGVLRNGRVAVKRIVVTSHTIDDKLFNAEVGRLLKTPIEHQNVVRFLGFCSNTHQVVIREPEQCLVVQKRERLLCFEYISNGSLDKHITGLEENPSHDKVLVDPVEGKLQNEAGQLCCLAGRDDQSTFVDPQWLRDSLLATGELAPCCSPGKAIYITAGTSSSSPVSPLGACWSPKTASVGPPLKARKSS